MYTDKISLLMFLSRKMDNEWKYNVRKYEYRVAITLWNNEIALVGHLWNEKVPYTLPVDDAALDEIIAWIHMMCSTDRIDTIIEANARERERERQEEERKAKERADHFAAYKDDAAFLERLGWTEKFGYDGMKDPSYFSLKYPLIQKAPRVLQWTNKMTQEERAAARCIAEEFALVRAVLPLLLEGTFDTSWLKERSGTGEKYIISLKSGYRFSDGAVITWCPKEGKWRHEGHLYDETARKYVDCIELTKPEDVMQLVHRYEKITSSGGGTTTDTSKDSDGFWNK